MIYHIKLNQIFYISIDPKKRSTCKVVGEGGYASCIFLGVFFGDARAVPQGSRLGLPLGRRDGHKYIFFKMYLYIGELEILLPSSPKRRATGIQPKFSIQVLVLGLKFRFKKKLEGSKKNFNRNFKKKKR